MKKKRNTKKKRRIVNLSLTLTLYTRPLCISLQSVFYPYQKVKSVLAGLPRAASPIQAVNQPPPPPAEPVVADNAPVAPVEADEQAPAPAADSGIVLPRVG